MFCRASVWAIEVAEDRYSSIIKLFIVEHRGSQSEQYLSYCRLNIGQIKNSSLCLDSQLSCYDRLFMFYHSSSLKEFVYPIPVCQPEADLNSILSIFQHLNCKMLAIPLAKREWGIITAENLLSLVAQSCRGEGTVLVCQPKNRGERKIVERAQFNLKALTEPVVVYHGDTKLDKFLGSFESTSWLREKKVCLIIDRFGALQGRLDRSKIIEYLAQKSTSALHKATSPSVASSLEKIALPVKIETVNGRVICANQLWQDLFTDNPPTVSKWVPLSEASMDEMTQWLIEQQGYISNQTEDFQVNNFSDIYSLDIEVKQTADWNYLKIPLAAKLEVTGANGLQYLVLAIANPQSEETKIEQIAVTSKMGSDRILTAVSHELKSPITGILGLSSMLQGQKLGSLNQRQMRYVKLIHRSGKKMMDIVDHLLQLNALTEKQSQPTELINLEFLCRQLYREVLTKLRSTEEQCDLALEMHRSQLSIELGSDMAIANKSLLSAILSHLLLEAIESGEFKPPKIKIKSSAGVTAISIVNQKTTPIVNLGLNWMIAECLSKALHSRVTHTCDSSSCQFTLLLPKNKTKYQSSLLAVAPTPQSPTTTDTNLTILCLYPELDVIEPLAKPSHNPNFDLKSWSDNYEQQAYHQHRIIEADSLEQAHNLARIWRLDAIVLNGYQIALPELYLRSLQEYEHLASLPLITLDARTTEAANRIEGLNVYPCLLSAQQCSIENLVQVIKIALETRTMSNER